MLTACSGQLTNSTSAAKCYLNTALSFLPLDVLCKCLVFFLWCFALGFECFHNFLELHSSSSDELSLDEILLSSVLASLSELISADVSDKLVEGECLCFLLCGFPTPLLDFLCLGSLSDKEWC